MRLRQDGLGLHWTPIDGATLLHLAVDFHEREMFDWLLAHGADVNARAAVDPDGFGGHTPLFNAVVCGAWHRATMSARCCNTEPRRMRARVYASSSIGSKSRVGTRPAM